MANPLELDVLVMRCKSPEDCDRLIRNAQEKGRDDLVSQARQRKIELRTAAHHPPPANEVERDCLMAIYAYEEILLLKHGRRRAAARSRGTVDRKGPIGAFEGFVNRPDGSAGFTKLKEIGLHNFAYEAVVARHPEHFSSEAVDRARARLAQFD